MILIPHVHNLVDVVDIAKSERVKERKSSRKDLIMTALPAIVPTAPEIQDTRFCIEPDMEVDIVANLTGSVHSKRDGSDQFHSSYPISSS